MREYKFRAWVNTELDPYMTYEVNGIDFDEKQVYVAGCFAYPFPKEAVLMQFTGLLDKNGKEIYEGDIVNFANRDFFEPEWTDKFKGNAVIKWVQEGCEYWVEFDGMNGKWLILRGDTWNEDLEEIESGHLEVIGNIYENPELLKTT